MGSYFESTASPLLPLFVRNASKVTLIDFNCAKFHGLKGLVRWFIKVCIGDWF